MVYSGMFYFFIPELVKQLSGKSLIEFLNYYFYKPMNLKRISYFPLKKFSRKDFKVVSKRKPSKSQLDNLIFAFNICRFVKSNAIVLASNYATLGIGSGQPSRLDSCKIAVDKMNRFSSIKKDIVAASDAFFPFVDGIEKLVQAGVTAVIQPSGSIKDKEIIRFANATDTVLLFSKTRHFRH